MVSFVSRHYMRVVNRSLVVCLPNIYLYVVYSGVEIARARGPNWPLKILRQMTNMDSKIIQNYVCFTNEHSQ